MINVTPEEVRHLAKLSRLKIEKDEEELFCSQFSQIIGYMDVLATVDTEGVRPLYTPCGHCASLRADDMDNKRSREEILANAPETDGENFIVPRII